MEKSERENRNESKEEVKQEVRHEDQPTWESTGAGAGYNTNTALTIEKDTRIHSGSKISRLGAL